MFCLQERREVSKSIVHSDSPWGWVNTSFIPLSWCNKFPMEGEEGRPLPLDAKHKYLLSSLSSVWISHTFHIPVDLCLVQKQLLVKVVFPNEILVLLPFLVDALCAQPVAAHVAGEPRGWYSISRGVPAPGGNPGITAVPLVSFNCSILLLSAVNASSSFVVPILIPRHSTPRETGSSIPAGFEGSTVNRWGRTLISLSALTFKASKKSGDLKILHMAPSPGSA